MVFSENMDLIDLLPLLEKIDGGYLPSEHERKGLAQVRSVANSSVLIHTLPESLAFLKNVESIDFSFLTTTPDLTPLQSLKNLQRLDISGSTAADLEPLRQLTGLRCLNLSQMPNIHTLPDWIGKLPLEYLDLSYLALDMLPLWLPDLGLEFSRSKYHPKQGIQLYKTTSKTDDMNIFYQSQEAIHTWFSQRLLPLNEMKVVFLGDGDTGKSHILARLMSDGGDPMAYASIVIQGVSIKDKVFDIDDRKVTVRFWDFGGQEILRSMHQLFLTERTLYVVALNARNNDQNARANYWLHNIKSFAKDAPVLLVLNKLDQNPNASLNEQSLKQAYPGLKRVIKMSALADSRDYFRSNFTAALQQELKNTGLIETTWPANWLRVRQALQNTDAYYITYREFHDICAKYHVEDQGEALLKWFHDLGICYHPSENSTSGLIVLKPEWVTNALYILLFNRPEGVRNGLIPNESIYRLLKSAHNNPDIRYTWREMDYILEVLRKYGLSYQFGRDYEFIPMLCSPMASHMARNYENSDDTLEFRMEFDYLPINVIHRLMVELHDDLDLDNVWHTGALFRQKSTDLSAVVTIDGILLKFFVRSESHHRPNTYLSTLKSVVDRICRTMDLPAAENILIYKEGGIRTALNYDDILLRLEMGESHYLVRELRSRVPIQNILNQTAPDTDTAQKLVEDVARACILLADSPFYATTSSIPQTLRSTLRANGYAIPSQPVSPIPRAGELDLIVYNSLGYPATIIETLTVRDKSEYLKKWEKHLFKLLFSYKSGKLSPLFLICCVDCEKEEFPNLWDRYREHISRYAPQRSELKSRSFSQPEGIWSKRPFLRVAKCDYYCGGTETTVYHIFLHISRKAMADVPSPTDPAQAAAEAEPRQAEPAQRQLKDDDHAEFRVVFLGDSEAGKTLILSRIKEPDMDPASFRSNTTTGIDIFSRVESVNGKHIRVNYWDFGGQEILHSLHRMFLASGTLYVIVLNTRNDNQDVQANFWLRYIQTYAPGAPVMLVMNKIDQNRRAALNLPPLRRQLIQGFGDEDVLRISAVEPVPKAFQTSFTDKLHARIAQLCGRTHHFSPEELRVRDILLAENKKIISENDFQDVCEQESIAAPELLKARFHNAGILVSLTEGTPVFLSPDWITDAIYRILNEGEHIAQNGVITHSEIRKLCRKNPNRWRGSDDAQFLLQIMQDYSLSFQCEKAIPGKADSANREFIPMLCQRIEPAQIEELVLEDHTVTMQTVFEYLPNGVLYNLMVDHQKDLNTKLTWLTGAMIGKKETGYTIIRQNGNTLEVFTHYPTTTKSVEKMAELDTQIKIIAEKVVYQAHVLEKKIGFRIAGGVEYFDYDRLMSAKSCDVEFVASKTNCSKVAVRDILDQEDRSERRDLDNMLRLTLQGCKRLQDDPVFWWRAKLDKQIEALLPPVDENARNRELKDALDHRFFVEDQHEGGEAAGGRMPGQMDLRICLRPKEPWSILEALIINGDDKASKDRWHEHLTRMAQKYNKLGLRYLILVSYLSSPVGQFELMKDTYRELLKHSTLEGYNGIPVCDSEKVENCPEHIDVYRADYSGGAGKMSVFHFLVHIPEYRGNPVDKKSGIEQ